MAEEQSTRKSLFSLWFAGKRWYQLLLCRKACPLRFNERLVYSYLTYRTARGGAKAPEVARVTGLDYHRTVPKVVASLTAAGLAARDEGRVVALPPLAPDWFVWRPDETLPWYRRLRGYPICHRPKGITPGQTAVYFCLLTGNVQEGRKIAHHQKRAGIAAMLRLSRATVSRAMKKFETLGLLEYDYLRPPPAEVLDRFPDRPTGPPKRKWVASIACGWKFGTLDQGPTMARWMDGASAKLLKSGYSKEEVLRYWEFAKTQAEKKGSILYEFLMNWGELFAAVEAETAKNRAAGKFAGPNSGGLLRERTRERIGKLILFGKTVMQVDLPPRRPR